MSGGLQVLLHVDASVRHRLKHRPTVRKERRTVIHRPTCTYLNTDRQTDIVQCTYTHT